MTPDSCTSLVRSDTRSGSNLVQRTESEKCLGSLGEGLLRFGHLYGKVVTVSLGEGGGPEWGLSDVRASVDIRRTRQTKQKYRPLHQPFNPSSGIWGKRFMDGFGERWVSGSLQGPTSTSLPLPTLSPRPTGPESFILPIPCRCFP